MTTQPAVTPTPDKKAEAKSSSENIPSTVVTKFYDEHGALHEILRVIGGVEHGEAVEQHTDKHGADDRAEYVGPAKPEHGEADQRGGDGVHHQRRARGNVATADAGGQSRP